MLLNIRFKIYQRYTTKFEAGIETSDPFQFQALYRKRQADVAGESVDGFQIPASILSLSFMSPQKKDPDIFFPLLGLGHIFLVE